MIINILILAAVLAAAFILFVASRPSDFCVSRTAIISAPPEALFAQVNNLQRWLEMSPYAKLDPTANYTYARPLEGEGATVAWDGNTKIGQGRMTIAESRANESVRFNLVFKKPFQATNSASFTFEPCREGTKVTWTMDGRSNFICKAVGLIVNCDKMIGDQFDEGLANMKLIAERQLAVIRN